MFVVVVLYCIVVVLFPKRSFYSSECLAICVRVMSESCQGHVGHVRVMWVMSGHVEISSGSLLGHFRIMTESCQLGFISIVKFTRRLETEGFSVLFLHWP